MEADRSERRVQSIMSLIRQREDDIPRIPGIDLYGITCALKDDLVPGTNTPVNDGAGGDHLLYVDFNNRFDLDERIRLAEEEKQWASTLGLERLRIKIDNLERNKRRAGVMIADVAGHEPSDAMITFALHHAFHEGVRTDIDKTGEITVQLLERINSRFYQSLSITKYITMLYGEIHDDGKFRFVSAGHPPPAIYSVAYDTLFLLNEKNVQNSIPIGFQPSDDDVDRRKFKTNLGFKPPYKINEITLQGAGDILIVYSDGLLEHAKGDELYFPARLAACLRENKSRGAKEIACAIWDDMNGFAERTDDVTYAVIKKS